MVERSRERLGAGVPHMISEKVLPIRSRPRGRPRTRVEVEDVPRLHLPSLMAAGQVVPGENVRTVLSGTRDAIVAEMKANRGQLVMQPHGGRCYLVRVVSDPQPFGGRRWWLVCPVTGRRASALYRSPGAAQFASRQAHGLGYRTQRLGTVARARERAATGQGTASG